MYRVGPNLLVGREAYACPVRREAMGQRRGGFCDTP